MGNVRRRQFLIAAGALLAAPAKLRAQQPGRSYRVGLFLGGTATAVARQRAAIVERLATHGFAVGRNLSVDVRIGNFNRVVDADVAHALVASRPDAILVDSTPLTLRAREATSAIPIVFTGVADPIGSGLVKNFSRPGGNVTGIYFSQLEIGAKRMELLRELVPNARLLVMAGDFGDPGLAETVPRLREVAARLGFELMEVSVSWIHGFPGVIGNAKPEAIINGQPWAIHGMEYIAGQIIRFAAERRIPSVFWESEMAELGATLTYGVNLTKELGRAADQLARVLKGATPAELPVDQATNYELVVNRKAAKALGITISPAILVRADRVIE